MADKKSNPEENKKQSDRYDDSTPDPRRYNADEMEQEQRGMEEEEEKIGRETNQRSKNP